MGFYKEYLSLYDDAELIRNLHIGYYPKSSDVNIRYIQLEELFWGDIYFDPLEFLFFDNKLIILPFIANVDGEIIKIDKYEDFLEIGESLFLTKDGIKKVFLNDKASIKKLTNYAFTNGRVYWIFSKTLNRNRVLYSVLRC